MQSDRRIQKKVNDICRENAWVFSTILRCACRRNEENNPDKGRDKRRCLESLPDVRNDASAGPIQVQMDSVRSDRCVSDCSSRICLRERQQTK